MDQPAQEVPDPALRLRNLSSGKSTTTTTGTTTPAEALAFFDSLEPVGIDDLLGAWAGSEVPTGHPLDGALSTLGWHGKRFEGPDAAHPLVFESTSGRLFEVDPRFVPLPLALRLGSLLGNPAGRVIRPLLKLAGTSRPRARIRMTEYRGVVSATMIYDALPINDVFRKVDADTVLGAMDVRGRRPPFMFALHREG